MKFKHWLNSIGSSIFAYILIIIFLPICLLLFIGAILYTPIDFIKFKRSTYQKDFPRKYKWLCGRHTDNGIYTTIKENTLQKSLEEIKHMLTDDFLKELIKG